MLFITIQMNVHIYLLIGQMLAHESPQFDFFYSTGDKLRLTAWQKSYLFDHPRRLVTIAGNSNNILILYAEHHDMGSVFLINSIYNDPLICVVDTDTNDRANVLQDEFFDWNFGVDLPNNDASFCPVMTRIDKSIILTYFYHSNFLKIIMLVIL